MDGASAGGTGRDPRRWGFRAVSFAGVLLAAAAIGVLWGSVRDAVAAPVGVAAAVAVLVALALVAVGLGGLAGIERRGFETRLAALAAENADLSRQTQELQVATRESDVLLGAAPVHLIMIDRDYKLVGRYPSELAQLFGRDLLADKGLLDALRPLLSEQMFKTARDYLALLFDGSRKERTLAKVNPLEEVEINAGRDQRFLRFGFQRVAAAGDVSRVLVSVEDVTERTRRSKRVRTSERQRVRQFELVLAILDAEPEALDGFMRSARARLGAIDAALSPADFASAAGKTTLLRGRLDIVLRQVHDVKGNAALLQLDHFEAKAHEFEERIQTLREQPSLRGDDFLALVAALGDFRSDLDDLEVLRAKLAGIKRNAEWRREGGDDVVASLGALVARLATKWGKVATFVAPGFDTRTLSPQRRTAVTDVLIQLVRNSVVHGVETPSEREALGKPRGATIEVERIPSTMPGGFAFVYRDDGRGLDAERIRARAIEIGLLSVHDAATIDESQVAGLIFEPGFSTARGGGSDAGRGIGMNLVKQRIVDDCGGDIALHSEAGRFCEFTFELPPAREALASIATS
jgi:signal transduction histidine kinase